VLADVPEAGPAQGLPIVVVRDEAVVLGLVLPGCPAICDSLTAVQVLHDLMLGV